MVHNAFDSYQLLVDVPSKIDAADCYDSKLLLGCADGYLRVYSPESDGPYATPVPGEDHGPSSPDLFREPYVLEKAVKGFAKKPILALQVLRSKGLLLSLSESISFHKFPNLETVAVITKAKGANVYSWDDRRDYLCFGRQKRVCIFRLDGGGGFVEVKEFGVPDIVKSMAWFGENICIGVKKEYMILNATTGALSSVLTSGRIAPPLVVYLPNGELFLGKDNIGIHVDQNGKPVNGGRICWSDAPTKIVIQVPFAVGILPRHVEIRSVQAPYSLIQTVVMRDVRHLARSNGTIVIILDNSIYGLFPVPLGAQIVQLTASGDFDEALALCKLLPPEDASLRAVKESSIHTRYAYSLFENESYEEAMEHFLASDVDITHVLYFYPYIVVPKSTDLPDPEEPIDDDLESPNPYADDMDLSPSAHLESSETASLECRKMSHNKVMALTKYLRKKRFSVIEKAASEGTNEVVLDAVGTNFKSHDRSRLRKSNKGSSSTPISSVARERASILDTALLQAFVLTGQPSDATKLLKGLNYCDVKICEEFLESKSHYAGLLELYNYNNMHREALNLLHKLVEESKSEQPQIIIKQKFTPLMIIDYLKPLCGTEPMLVLEFAKLVLESCPTETIELFLSGNIPADLVSSYLKQHAPSMQAKYLEYMLSADSNAISGSLQNEIVQIYLSEVLEWYRELSSQKKWDEKTYSPTRTKLLATLESIQGYNPEGLLKQLPTDALYEERAMLFGRLNQHELALSLYVHKLHVPALAVSYCDRIYESQLRQTPAKSHSIYLVLLQIYLNPRRTTRDFERRISRVVSSPTAGLSRVSSASGIKVKGGRGARKIAEIEGAEDIMCQGVSSAESGKSDGDADEPVDDEGSNNNIMLDEALDLLSQRWERINGAQALKLLPRETKLKDLLTFLGPLLRKSSEAYRNFAVIKRLRQSESLQVKDELYTQRKHVVKVTGDTMCSLCNKKIGASVFAVYPNGNTLVHFACFRDSQSMRAVKGSQPRKRN